MIEPRSCNRSESPCVKPAERPAGALQAVQSLERGPRVDLVDVRRPARRPGDSPPGESCVAGSPWRPRRRGGRKGRRGKGRRREKGARGEGRRGAGREGRVLGLQEPSTGPRPRPQRNPGRPERGGRPLRTRSPWGSPPSPSSWCSRRRPAPLSWGPPPPPPWSRPPSPASPAGACSSMPSSWYVAMSRLRKPQAASVKVLLHVASAWFPSNGDLCDMDRAGTRTPRPHSLRSR